MTNVIIEPDTITTTQTVTSFDVVCRSLTLFVTASFLITSYDSLKNIVSTAPMVLTPEQYLEWNNNDVYIIKLAATQLGYTIKP